MRSVVLTGFMGTGKTAVGRELSRLLGMRFVDIDQEIEQTLRSTVADIFEKQGEDYFRRIETETIRRFSLQPGIIISTGGGAVLREENMKSLEQNSMIFCLTASPGVILDRIGSNADRPLLRGEDKKTRITELLEQRKPFYEKAGIIINTEGKTPLEIAEEIAERYHG